MEIKIGCSYKILVNINSVLTYYGDVISQDDVFVTFIDDRNKTHIFNKVSIISLVLMNDFKKETIEKSDYGE